MKKQFTLITTLFLAVTTFAQIPTNGLQLHYKFDGNTTDLSSNNLDCTTTGTIYVNSGAPGDSALTNFDGPETYLNYTGNESLFENQEFTIFANYKPYDVYKLYSNIVEIGNSAGTHIYMRLFNDGFGWYLQAGHYNAATSTGNHAQIFFDSYMTDYHMITMTTEYDPVTTLRNIHLYVDGHLIHSANYNNYTLIPYSNATSNMQFLGRSGTSTMDALGWLDEFIYYDRFMDETEVTSIATLGTPVISSNDSFKVFPNPVKEELKLIDLPNNANIRILDQTGKRLEETISTSTMLQLDLSFLTNGIYFVEVESENGIVNTQKIIKN